MAVEMLAFLSARHVVGSHSFILGLCISLRRFEPSCCAVGLGRHVEIDCWCSIAMLPCTWMTQGSPSARGR
eukprot:144177-Amphidinium_carterae.1